jgi:L-seryl-tRNA(Ser) seleniumtransferase
VLLALQQVALAYLDRSAAGLPFWSMVSAPLHELRKRAERIVAESGTGRVVDSEAVPGAGSAPGVTLPSVAVELDGDVLRPLRHHTPPVVARRRNDSTLLDLRSVHPDDDVHLIAALRSCVS